jgi:tetratricopeptide (TPR) repeat protein
VSDGFNLWSEQYDRELDDIFAVQKEIAISIADRLKVTLVGLEPPTENVEAYDLYLKGRFFWARRGEGLNRARDFFGQALAIDPDFALAHAGLADVYSLLGFYGGLRPEESMPQAKAAAERALELDDTLAEAHATLGWVALTYEWIGADRNVSSSGPSS